jgi:hypothetical protein
MTHITRNFVRGYQNYLKSVVSISVVEDRRNRFLLQGDTHIQFYILPQPTRKNL